MVKAYLSRVGADKGNQNLGCLGPLFKDDYRFEYIPMNEGGDTFEDRTFSEIDARFSDKKLSSFIPKKWKGKKPHFDPEFETFTYGDSTTDRKKFLELEKGDILVFYAGLDPWKESFKRKEGEGSCYIIGYFTVKDVVDFSNCDEGIFNKYPQLLKNAHLRMKNVEFRKGDWIDLVYKEGEDRLLFDDETCKEFLGKYTWHHQQYSGYDSYIDYNFARFSSLVVVIGDDKKSKLLEEAIPISEPRKDTIGREYCAVSKKMEKKLGIEGSIQRKGNGNWIRGEEHIENLKELLDY